MKSSNSAPIKWLPFKSLLLLSQDYPEGKIRCSPLSGPNHFNSIYGLYEYLKGVTIARQFVNRYYYDFVSCHSSKQVIEVGGRKSLHMKLGFSDKVKALDIIQNNDIDICADVENLGFSDASIDRFVCISVLEHVQNPGKAMSEMLRCLKPGGQILLSVPWMFEMHMEPRDYFRYTVEGIELLCGGARIVKVMYSNGYFGLLAHFLQKSIALRWLIGSFFYVCSLIEKPSERFASQLHLILEKPLEPDCHGK